jgi:hypothetical protein
MTERAMSKIPMAPEAEALLHLPREARAARTADSVAAADPVAATDPVAAGDLSEPAPAPPAPEPH